MSWNPIPGLILPLTLLAAPALRAQAAPSYTELLAQAESLRKAGKLKAAFTLSSQASKQEPERHEAYLVSGLILYRQGAEDTGREFLQRAMKLAPAAEREGLAEIQSLLEAGRKDRDAARHHAAGVAAANQGLLDKARREFLAAWKLQPFDLANAERLAAVCQRTGQVYDLARVLRRLEQSPRPQDAPAVAKLLEGYGPLLQRQHLAAMRRASGEYGKSSWLAAERSLKLAILFDPAPARPHFMRAVCSSRIGEHAAAVGHLRAALARGFYQAELCVADPGLSWLHGERDFVQLIRDAFGEAQARRVMRPLSKTARRARIQKLLGEARQAGRKGKWQQAGGILAEARAHLQGTGLDAAVHLAMAVVGSWQNPRGMWPRSLKAALKAGNKDLSYIFDEGRRVPLAVLQNSKFLALMPAQRRLAPALVERSKQAFLRLHQQKKGSTARLPGYAAVFRSLVPHTAVAEVFEAILLARKRPLNKTAVGLSLLRAAERGFVSLDFVVQDTYLSRAKSDPTFRKAMLRIAKNREARKKTSRPGKD